MMPRVLKPGESIPEGAVRVHLYPFELILNPRGGDLDKESLGRVLADHLIAAYEHWTDPKYGDSRAPEEVFERLTDAAEDELVKAVGELRRRFERDQQDNRSLDT